MPFEISSDLIIQDLAHAESFAPSCGRGEGGGLPRDRVIGRGVEVRQHDGLHPPSHCTSEGRGVLPSSWLLRRRL